MQNQKTGTKHLFQAVFFAGYISRQYKLHLRAFTVSRKPAINFLMPAISSKTFGLRVYYYQSK